MSKRYLDMLNGQKTDRPPFWYLRQAGRYLPEYRDVRARSKGFLDMCYTSAYAVEVTLQPIRRFEMDASIIFSDILIVPHALGIEVTFEQGEGPKLKPIKTGKELSALVPTKDRFKPVYEAISEVKAKLPSETTLIGFCGSPWTLACYVVEGKGSKNFEEVLVHAYKQPQFFDHLIDVLTDAVAEHSIAQIDAGAEVIQLFDSWAGVASVDIFERYIIKPTYEIVKRIKSKYPHVKIVGFPRGAGAKLSAYAKQTNIDVLHVDQFTPIEMLENVDLILQGNIDPIALMTDMEKVKAQLSHNVEAMKNKPYVINLGHGVLQHTPPENVAQLSDWIKTL